MAADQVRRALAEVCGYHDGPDCQHCADTYAHAQLHKGMSDDEILADIHLYRSDFRTWEAKVRAAGRRQAADAIRNLVDDLTDADPCWYDHHGYCQAHGWMATDPRCPHARAKEFLAAAEGAPAEPVEGTTRG